VHGSLPSLDQFGSVPVDDLSGMTYELATQSRIEVNDPSQIAGSDLVLVARSQVGVEAGALLNMVELDANGDPIVDEDGDVKPTGVPLALGSLTTCNGDCDSPDDNLITFLGLTQSVDTQTGISLAGPVIFGSAPTAADPGVREDRRLTAIEGDITLASSVVHGGGGTLRITASNGDVVVARQVRTDDEAPVLGVVGTPDSRQGGDVEITGKNVTVSAVDTTASAGEAGDIALTATDGAITLPGDTSFIELDARGGFANEDGDITLTAQTIRIGSDEADRTVDEIEVSGRDVMFDGEIAVQRSEDSEARVMLVQASGAVEFTGPVELDALEIAGADGVASGSILFGDSVAGGLLISARGNVEFHGDVDSKDVTAKAGLGGDGEIVLGAGVRLDVEELDLRSDGTLDLEDLDFVHAPTKVVLRQDAGFTAADIHEVVSAIDDAPVDPDAPSRDRTLGFISNLGAVVADAADVNGTHLLLGAGEEGVSVQGALDVLTLDLNSDASFDGGVVVRRSTGGTGVEGFDAEGDVIVEDGDLLSYSRIRLNGESTDHAIDVKRGEFSAPAIERTVTIGGHDTRVTVAAMSEAEVPEGAPPPIRLLGSFGRRELVRGPESATLFRGGSVTFLSDTTALGDVVADQDVEFAAKAFFTSKHTRARTQEEVDAGITPDAQVVGLDQDVEATNGVLTIGNAISKPSGDLRLAAGERYSIDCPDGCDVAVTTADDLELSGDGELTGVGDTRKLESTGGDVTLDGTLEFDGALEVEAGSGENDAIRTGRGGVTLEARSIDLASDIEGEGDLTAIAEHIDVGGEVALGRAATLTLDAVDRIEFTRAGSQTVESGSLSLDPEGREPPLEATITGKGDLVLSATSGSFSMGQGSKLTTLGKLDIRAARDATISDLGAMEISVTASSIRVAERGGADVQLPVSSGGGVTRDRGVDVVANRVTFSETPDNDVTIGTPTTTEISDSLAGDTVLVRSIFQNGRELEAGDFACPGGVCDLVAQGSALFEAARQLAEMPPEDGPESFQLLRELNTVGVSARPPWAQELVAYLERASLGGDELPPEFDDPRLTTPPVQSALRVYQGLFAPSSRFDESSGAQVLRSHRDRIAVVLQKAEDDYVADRGEPPTGESFFAYVSRGSRHGEALFYLSAFADLTRYAAEAGVRGEDLGQFTRLLVEDVAPYGLGADGLTTAVPFP